jgi:hypothetical protein
MVSASPDLLLGIVAVGQAIMGEPASWPSEALGGFAAVPSVMAPYRDPEIAIEEEFEYLRRRGSVEAMDLFIARHPGHPLTDRAKRIRALMLDANPGVSGESK